MECIRLRIQDLDFDRNLVYVRGAKGGKDRTTLLPQSIHEDLNRDLYPCNAERPGETHKPPGPFINADSLKKPICH